MSNQIPKRPVWIVVLILLLQASVLVMSSKGEAKDLADVLVQGFGSGSVSIFYSFLADFSFGFRYALGTQGSIFFGGIVPLNDDGFRADFIPSGGVEYTF